MKKPGYIHSDLGNILKDFLAEESCYQLVNSFTRIRNVAGELQRSCLDHIIVNCINKVSNVEILGVGDSDHMGTLVTKVSHEVRSRPRTIMKRIYKNFDKKSFLDDIAAAENEGLFAPLYGTDDIIVASDIFSQLFKNILDQHAPLKVIQNRNNYIPYISSELKELMNERDKLKGE